MMENSAKAVWTRYDLVLGFVRVFLLFQVVNLVFGVLQIVVNGVMRSFVSSPYLSMLSSWGFTRYPFVAMTDLAFWLLAPALVRGAVGDRNADVLPSWRTLVWPCLGFALILGNFGQFLVATLDLASTFLPGLLNGASMASPFSSKTVGLNYYMISILLYNIAQLLLGLGLAFVPPIRARWRAAKL